MHRKKNRQRSKHQFPPVLHLRQSNHAHSSQRRTPNKISRRRKAHSHPPPSDDYIHPRPRNAKYFLAGEQPAESSNNPPASPSLAAIIPLVQSKMRPKESP